MVYYIKKNNTKSLILTTELLGGYLENEKRRAASR